MIKKMYPNQRFQTTFCSTINTVKTMSTYCIVNNSWLMRWENGASNTRLWGLKN